MGKPLDLWIDETQIENLTGMHFVALAGETRSFAGTRLIEAAPTLSALTKAEEALTLAVNVVDKRSPSWRDMDKALKLVREVLGVGPRWLDKKKVER